MIGSGGHANVIVDILRERNISIVGVATNETRLISPVLAGLSTCSDSEVEMMDPDEVMLVNAIGSMPRSNIRERVQQKFIHLGFQFMTVVAPSAHISRFAILEPGVQVLPGAIINANSRIGQGTIINSGAIIEHDCTIGCFNHIAPGAVLSGAVVTENNVHIATGAKVIQGIRIGAHSIIGAGATVTKSIESEHILFVAKPFLRKGILE